MGKLTEIVNEALTNAFEDDGYRAEILAAGMAEVTGDLWAYCDDLHDNIAGSEPTPEEKQEVLDAAIAFLNAHDGGSRGK